MGMYPERLVAFSHDLKGDSFLRQVQYADGSVVEALERKVKGEDRYEVLSKRVVVPPHQVAAYRVFVAGPSPGVT